MYKVVNYKKLLIFLVVVLILSFCSFSLANFLSRGKKSNPRKFVLQKNLLALPRDNISLKFEGRFLNIKQPIYVVHNRYYIPLSELINNTSLGKISQKDNTIKVQLVNQQVTINLSDNSYVSANNTHRLKKKIFQSGNNVYLSLFDICKMFNLKTYWDLNQKTITLYPDKELTTVKPYSRQSKYALVRLEDVSVEGHYATAEDLEKLRVMANYLYQEDIPFHVAWVPRYIDPRPGFKIDNDLSNNNNIYNADFLFTLDYMLDRDGLIGLHGYTHQHGNLVSINATEFHSFPKDNIPDTEQYTQDRINHAIQAAKDLDIPYAFFEAPHYAISANRYKDLENNFDYIYEPYVGNPYFDKIVVKKSGSRIIRYIPTPLDYTNGKADIYKIIHRIDNLKPGVVGSFFFHPYLDFNDIKITRDQTGYPTYTYQNNSSLHLIVNELHKKGYSFVSIYDIK